MSTDMSPVRKHALQRFWNNLKTKFTTIDNQIAQTQEDITDAVENLNASDISADGIGDKTVSGNPIVIEDGMTSVAKELSVTLEPIQDLHGYDHPWVEGAGKNKLPLTVDGIKALNPSSRGTWTGNTYEFRGIKYELITNSTGAVVRIHISGQNADPSYMDIAKISSIPYGTYIINGGNSHVGSRAYNYDGTNSATSRGADITITTTEASGDNTFDIIVSKSDEEVNTDVYPMLRLASETDATFEPYSNICPISGRTEVNVERTGKNLLPTYTTTTISGVTFTANSDGTVTVSGTATSDDIIYRKTVDVSAGGYKLNGGVSSDYSIRVGASDGTFITQHNGGNPVAISINEATQLQIALRIRYMNGQTVNAVYFPMLFLASETDATFEPYQGQSVTVQLGQTVYGGTLNISTGELVVNTWYEEYDGSSDEQWGSYMDRFYIIPSHLYRTDSQSNCKSNMYRYIGFVTGSQSLTDTSTFGLYKETGQTPNRVYLYDTKYTNVPELKAALAIEPLTVCYELATPTTIQLTAQQLTLLEGYNILTTDGTINLTYLGSEASNVQDEIDEFEAVTNNLVASFAYPETTAAKTSHAVGDYIMLNNQFCKVTQAISAGETIRIGTNVKVTTIADELKSIFALLNS